MVRLRIIVYCIALCTVFVLLIWATMKDNPPINGVNCIKYKVFYEYNVYNGDTIPVDTVYQQVK